MDSIQRRHSRRVGLVILGFILASTLLGVCQSPFLQHRRTASRPPPAGGGGVPTGNSWTFQAASNNAGKTCDISGVAAGDIVVAFMKWEGSGQATALAYGGSGTNLTLTTIYDHGNGDLHIRGGYLLNPPGGNWTLTATTNANVAFLGITILRFHSSGTFSADVTAGGSGTSTAVASSTFTSGSVNGVAVQAYGKYSAATLSSQTVGGNSATRTPSSENEMISWYYLNSAQLVSATGNATLSGSNPWITTLLTFIAQ